MRNRHFEIEFNGSDGTVSSIVLSGDPCRMNWSSQKAGWGSVRHTYWKSANVCEALKFVSFQESGGRAVSVYENGTLRVTAERFFDEDGLFTERYTFRNLGKGDLFLKHGDIGIALPLNDSYPNAEECMGGRCHAHLWCGRNTAYVCALKMGESDRNLGLVLTRGALESYSVEGVASNQRGTFILDPAHQELCPQEEAVLEWKLFVHEGWEDFYRKAAAASSQFVRIAAKHYTVFENETVSFEARLPEGSGPVQVLLDGSAVPYQREGRTARVEYAPGRLGEHRFVVRAGEAETFADFFVAERFGETVRKRIDFIVDRQQYHRKESALDGAYLVYDLQEGTHVFNASVRDYNACRERIGMALLIAKYLQRHEDGRLEKSLRQYIAFMEREFYDERTGEVFDGAGRIGPVRLYNAPWAVTFFVELYYLFREGKYLDRVVRMLGNYYEKGGERFYPNGFSPYQTWRAFKDAGREKDASLVEGYFRRHADNMVKNGLLYPKHEVNYEQTIVCPAATILTDVGRITGDPVYLAEAEKHMGVLRRFNGRQPSFHLNETPIRYWDDFWFGKSRLFGDTFPHYWSCLTAWAFENHHRVTGDPEILEAAKEGMRNCLCLFNERGEGFCAYVYPFRANGVPGQFYDQWANDQDFALYFAMRLEAFSGEY